jgi:hypothetical protein
MAINPSPLPSPLYVSQAATPTMGISVSTVMPASRLLHLPAQPPALSECRLLHQFTTRHPSSPSPPTTESELIATATSTTATTTRSSQCGPPTLSTPDPSRANRSPNSSRFYYNSLHPKDIEAPPHSDSPLSIVIVRLVIPSCIHKLGTEIAFPHLARQLRFRQLLSQLSLFPLHVAERFVHPERRSQLALTPRLRC